MNLAVLKPAIAHILAHPEQHYQRAWVAFVSDHDTPPDTSVDPWCGTVACLAGRVSLLAGDKPAVYAFDGNNFGFYPVENSNDFYEVGEYDAQDVFTPTGEKADIQQRAADLLGLDSYDESNWWFAPYREVSDFTEALLRIETFGMQYPAYTLGLGREHELPR